MAIEPYIETYTGKHFYFLDPKPDMICIEDIAHALSNNCRFGGHCREFYSVAEHSIWVSRMCDNPLEGLLHDASEAYLVDIPKPVKQHLPDYRVIEEKVMIAIADKFAFGWPMSADLHDADATMLKVEAKQLLRTGGREWLHEFPTKRDADKGPTLAILAPRAAEALFMEEYKRLCP
jgi:hypothetical protein